MKKVDIDVTDNWLRLIHYVRSHLPHGEITIRVAGGEPIDLIGEKKKIRFDKADYFADME